MKKTLLLIIFSLTVLTLPTPVISDIQKEFPNTSYTGARFTDYPKRCEAAIKALERLPEVRHLLDNVKKEGRIKIEYNSECGRNEGIWNANQRTIMLKPRSNATEADLIITILFELHNAYRNKDHMRYFDLAQRGKITKDQFVENIERIEHDNAMKTIAILKKGVAQGIFPKNTQWEMMEKFENYYQHQQLTGHSQYIASLYDHMNRGQWYRTYRGTVPGINFMSQEDKYDMERYLWIKNDLESNDQNNIVRGTRNLEREITHLEACAKKSNSCKSCKRYFDKIQILKRVLNDNPVFEVIAKKMNI